MGTHLINIADAPDISEKSKFDAADGVTREDLVAAMTSRFLGRDWQTGPWVVYVERKAGHVTRAHKHFANRVEFLFEGTIEWHEKGKEPQVYGPGTMSYVDAGTVYGYTVLSDAKILIVFDAFPGYHTPAESKDEEADVSDADELVSRLTNA